MVKIDPNICKEPFPNLDTVLEKASCHAHLINELYNHAVTYNKIIASTQQKMNDGCIKTLNNGVQPFIITVYGPTGSGKSQFIRNIISSRLIEPHPETIFFITPESNTISTEEQMTWEMQCIEGNYTAECKPVTSKFRPIFIQLGFKDAINDENLNIDNSNNIFARAAEKGPIAIIIDECMNILGSYSPISSFFHALPSKIFSKFTKCTGYTVIVVLHNMNPRHDRGNIKDLKIQSKCHVISPQLESTQISRFIKNYSFGFPTALIAVLKDIVDHARMNSKYSWLIYNNVPACESFRWSYYSPDEQLKPVFMNVQSLFYNSCQEIRRVFRKRTYAQLQYIKKLNEMYM